MNVFYFLIFSSYSNQKNNKLMSCCCLPFPGFFRLQGFCPSFMHKIQGAALFKYTTLFIHPAGCMLFNVD